MKVNSRVPVINSSINGEQNLLPHGRKLVLPTLADPEVS
jgi:hypothetical protein